MSNITNVEVKLTLDDGAFNNDLNAVASNMRRIQGESNKTNDAIGEAFDTKEVDKFNKSLDKTKGNIKQTGKELDNAGKRSKKSATTIDGSFRKIGRSARRVSSGIRGAFARTGIGVLVIGIASLLSGFGDLKNKALDSLGGIGDFIRSTIDVTRDFLSTITFGLIDSSEQVAEGIKKNIASINAAIAKTVASRLAIEAETEVKLAKLRGAGIEEIAELERNISREKRDEIEILIGAERDRISALREQVELLEKQQKLNTNIGRGLELVEEQLKAEKEIEEAKTNIILLDQQRIDEALNFQKINSDLAAQQRKNFEDRKRRDEQEAARKKKEAEEEKRRLEDIAKKQLELRLQFLVDDETAELIRNQNAGQRRKEEAAKVIEDANELSLIQQAIDRETERKRNEIIKKFADERAKDAQSARQQELQELQSQLDADIQFRKAQKDEVQALRRAEFNSIEQTENDIERFEEEQQKERLQQELMFQKERLQLTLQFADLRSEAQNRAIEQEIASIDALIAEINTRKATSEKENESDGGGFLQSLLGLDDDQLEALKKAGQFVKDQIGDILQTRIDAFNTEIDARNKRLGELRSTLDAETTLLEEGRTADVQGTLDQIAQQEAARDEAMKKQKAAVIAQQVLDTITQTSSLITASAQIFAAYAPLQPIGTALAIAQIALMFGAFAAAKATAFSSAGAQDVALYTGGRIKTGESDENGGKGLRVEGTKYKVGRGEWIVNARSSEMHDDFLSALNSGAFDSVDLMDLVGKKASKSILRNETKYKRIRSRKVQERRNEAIKNELRKQTGQLSNGLDNIMNKSEVTATNDYYIIKKEDKYGNVHIKKVNINK